jgi:hypothetical protein
MPGTYIFRYFNPEGGLIRMSMKQCASMREALAIAVADCGECQRIQISLGDRIVWSGSVEQAKAA